MKFRVLGCRGDWLQVINARHGNVWIDKWCGARKAAAARLATKVSGSDDHPSGNWMIAAGQPATPEGNLPGSFFG